MINHRGNVAARGKVTVYILGFLLAFMIVDVLSLATEKTRQNLTPDFLYIFVVEGTAILALALSLPIISYINQRFPLDIVSMKTTLCVHIASSIFVAVFVIVLMTALRHFLLPFCFDEVYSFGSNWLQEVIYEYRKILLFYAGSVAFYTVGLQLYNARQELAAATQEARETRRITLKSSGRTFFVHGKDILWIKSGMNYLDIKTSANQYLVRGTLKDMETCLSEAGVNFARVHRSYIVNLDGIQDQQSDGEGGLVLTMDDNQNIPCSRKYRSSLKVNLS
jgi:hypothetical protein